MRNSDWLKNLFFVGLASVGFLSLAVFLMASDRIAEPITFRPHSTRQLEIVNKAELVDAAFQSDWTADGLSEKEFANKADSLMIARRLSLGITGTVPSVQEIREFEAQPEELRIDWWVSRLLEDSRTSSYLAERFTRAFLGVEEGEFIVYRRRRFVSWLSEQLSENKKYDKIVMDLLTDEGLWTDTPSVNFYTATIAGEGRPDPIRLAGRTSRALVGMRIDCLQCHDDFLGTINLGDADDPAGGLQTDFHSLAAFFSGSQLSILGVNEKNDRDYKYKLLDDEEESVIEPRVPFARDLVDENISSRQKRLAKWVTHPENRPFSRAAVNRVWAIMCGKPLVEPVDDIPLEGPFPEAMEVLVDQFIESKFDLHQLIRTIAHTRAFQRDSHADFEITDEHVDNWRVFPLVRLRPDQVAGALTQATSLTALDETAHIVARLTQFGQENEFVERYGDPGEDEFISRGETVTQRLLMLNGNMLTERIRNPLNSPIRIGGLSPDSETAIETVFLSTLTRRPTEEEMDVLLPQIKDLQGRKRTEKIVDLYWVLMNGVEFAWNH